MNPQTLQALKDSIAHWERLSTGFRLPLEHIGATQCPLCNIFNQIGQRDALYCIGCPVYEKTKLQYCINTPYEEASIATRKYNGIDSIEFKEAAKKELEFLRSLLPKEN